MPHNNKMKEFTTEQNDVKKMEMDLLLLNKKYEKLATRPQADLSVTELENKLVFKEKIAELTEKYQI